MLALYARAERIGPWPQQMIVGFVSALAKTVDASEVHHYRPVTVFSLCYRGWGSIHSRQALKHLASIAPRGLSGGVPGRVASDIWWRMQLEVETSIIFEEPLAGLWQVHLLT